MCIRDRNNIALAEVPAGYDCFLVLIFRRTVANLWVLKSLEFASKLLTTICIFWRHFFTIRTFFDRPKFRRGAVASSQQRRDWKHWEIVPSLYAGDSHAVGNHWRVLFLLGTQMRAERPQTTWSPQSAHRSRVLCHGKLNNCPLAIFLIAQYEDSKSRNSCVYVLSPLPTMAEVLQHIMRLFI